MMATGDAWMWKTDRTLENPPLNEEDWSSRLLKKTHWDVSLPVKSMDLIKSGYRSYKPKVNDKIQKLYVHVSFQTKNKI